MATQIKKNNLSKIFAALKNKKKNPDWARIEEPDVLLKNFEYVIYGVVITAFLVLLTWGVMSASPIIWIAQFLASLNSSLPFEQQLAAFGAAVIILINMLLTVIFMIFAPASNDDVVEMVSDLDGNIQDRIVELENTFNEQLNSIITKIDDQSPATHE